MLLEGLDQENDLKQNNEIVMLIVIFISVNC